MPQSQGRHREHRGNKDSREFTQTRISQPVLNPRLPLELNRSKDTTSLTIQRFVPSRSWRSSRLHFELVANAPACL